MIVEELAVIEACAARVARRTSDSDVQELALLVARLASLVREQTSEEA